MVTDDLALAQTTTSIVSAGVEKSSIATPVAKTLAVCPSLEVATTQDIAHTSTSKAPLVISTMKKLLVQLAPALKEATSTPPSTSKSMPVATVETSLMSTIAHPE